LKKGRPHPGDAAAGARFTAKSRGDHDYCCWPPVRYDTPLPAAIRQIGAGGEPNLPPVTLLLRQPQIHPVVIVPR